MSEKASIEPNDSPSGGWGSVKAVAFYLIRSPRMAHPLQHARRGAVPLVAFNLVAERRQVSFTNPQSPINRIQQHKGPR